MRSRTCWRPVRIVRELSPDKARIGFCGGTFTAAGYLVEGRPSRDFVVVKTLMYRNARADGAARRGVHRLRAGEVGAEWCCSSRLVGRLALAGRLRGARRAATAGLLAALDVPTIHFGTGTAAGLLAQMADRRRRRDRRRLADRADRRGREIGDRGSRGTLRASGPRRGADGPTGALLVRFHAHAIGFDGASSDASFSGMCRAARRSRRRTGWRRWTTISAVALVLASMKSALWYCAAPTDLDQRAHLGSLGTASRRPGRRCRAAVRAD